MSHLWTNIQRYTGPAGTKRLSIDFAEALMIPFLGERVRLYNGFKSVGFKNYNGHF